MVTYRQAGRGMVRTLRAIDREAKRAQRQRVAYERAAQRQALLEASADAAQQYEALIAALIGAHRIAFRRRDWLTLATEPVPPIPQPSTEKEDAARLVETAYRPGWFARTFGLEAGQRSKLAAAVLAGRAADEVDLENRIQAADARRSEIEFAQSVVAQDHAATAEALDRYSELGGLPFSLEEVDVVFTEDKRLIAMVDGLDLEDMPEQSVTLLQSGKASIKALARTRILELHRDTICAGSMRVALECLQTLPLDAVEVVMHTDILDPATGHIQSEPVLYLRVAAQALETLNLVRSEASPLVERLGGHFDWNKRDGFRAINLAAFNVPTDTVIEA
ncbi:hypothetical protein [Phenylobacterium aquaticum]|uniref:hypothetical protein n=1 Tax=Phenylobacterium aquaticum TaxID=1763816 RepID=UPI001F5D93D7|nr:hypothetical protein [Phenylobacterium aquaticum]MCI3132061.1 hypothetical protein [Phenylobacterium aquaticum]